jgi:hypothetical protein
MAKIGIDLREIREKQPLVPGVYTFTVRKSGLEPSKDQTSNNVVLELVPQESPSDIVFHRFSMKPGALTATDTAMSLKRFLDTVNIPYGPDFDTDALFGVSFRGMVKHEVYNGKTQVRLGEVLGR